MKFPESVQKFGLSVKQTTAKYCKIIHVKEKYRFYLDIFVDLSARGSKTP